MRYLMVVAWLLAPPRSSRNGSALLEPVLASGAACGRNIISEVSVSVCVFAHGESLSMASASFLDHSCQGFDFFCPLLVTVVEVVNVASSTSRTSFLKRCIKRSRLESRKLILRWMDELKICLRSCFVGNLYSVFLDLSIECGDLGSKQTRRLPLTSASLNECTANQLPLEPLHLSLQVNGSVSWCSPMSSADAISRNNDIARIFK